MECFLIVTTLWVFSVCLHEFGHAWVAYLGGDYTVRDKGYLTMNPIHYTDPVTSLLIPVVFVVLGGIGLPGGAVYIERQLLRSRGWETGMSLAGPAMNLLLVLILGLLFRAGVVPPTDDHLSSVALALLLQLQISALILNLLPIPPLDGFQAISPWLPQETRVQLYAMSNQALWILFLLLWFVPPVRDGFWTMVYAISDVLGVPSDLAFSGWRAFRFWRNL